MVDKPCVATEAGPHAGVVFLLGLEPAVLVVGIVGVLREAVDRLKKCLGEPGGFGDEGAVGCGVGWPGGQCGWQGGRRGGIER